MKRNEGNFSFPPNCSEYVCAFFLNYNTKLEGFWCLGNKY